MSTKRERDGFYIPQQDGASDEVTEPNTYDLNGNFEMHVWV